jgi:hypothetical protein
LPEDVPILPILQTLKKHMALRQQVAAGAAAASTAAARAAAACSVAVAPAAAPSFGAAAAGGVPTGNETPTLLHRLLQQNRQLQTIAAANSGSLERQQGEGPPAVGRSASTLTNSTGVAGVGLYIPAASVEAARLQQQQQQQQQQAARAAGVEGPYSSYLDAELLNLYSEFKTTRQQVRIDCYSAA